MSNCKAACKSVKHHCREGTCLDAGDTEPTPLPLCAVCKKNAMEDTAGDYKGRDIEVACKPLGASIRGMFEQKYGLGCENAATCL